jgi:FkbM family methyltransferase
MGSMDMGRNWSVALRKTALWFLKITSADIKIKHHYTGNTFVLNSYLHKGYWFYGKKREFFSMQRFSEIVKPGMTVLEIGGHIGYLATYYSFLVGQSGKVIVFEPGKNNLAYLNKNVKFSSFKNIIIEEIAAGNQNCTMTFYLDPLTGQNNSLVKDFDGFIRNRELSVQPSADSVLDTVKVVRLDDYFENKELPDFIKIDIEGFEWECLEGLKTVIEKRRPILMIEIQSNSDKILRYFKSISYRFFNERMEELFDSENDKLLLTPNIFFFPDVPVSV